MISTLTFPLISGLPDIRMAPPAGPEAAQSGVSSFDSVLKDFAASAANTLKQGEAAALSGIEGQIPVQSVVEQVMAAERTLQAAIAVRDKLVSSYLEISRMQV